MLFKKYFAISISVFIFVCTKQARVAQLVEHQLPKLRVASSNLVSRSDKSIKIKALQKTL